METQYNTRSIIKHVVWLIAITIVVTSCKKTEEIQHRGSWNMVNERVYSIMKEWYFWHDNIPDDMDMSRYETPQEAMDALAFQTLDSWSYVENQKNYEDYFINSVAVAYGFAVKWNENGQMVFSFISNNSPAYEAGIKRGFKITKVNGIKISQIKNFVDFYPDAAGETIDLEILDLNNNEKQVRLSARQINTESVPYFTTFTQNGTVYGYILINSFVQETPMRIDVAFDNLSIKGATELIVDLRYNGGGYVNGALHLMNRIIPASKDKRVAYSYVFNDSKTSSNYSVTLEKKGRESYERVFFLTTNRTASASELVINSLRPHVSVVQIGYPTHGKPVGMFTFVYDNYAISPICFATVNDNNEGYYYEGLSPDLVVAEDLSLPLGDANDPLVKAALTYGLSKEKSGSLTNGNLTNKSLEFNGLRSFINLY